MEMSVTFMRRADVTDPDDLLAWRTTDEDGRPVLRDFTGWSFSMEIIHPTTNVVSTTKLTGIAGGDGTGKSNLAVAWTAEEMGELAGPTRWKGRILANLEDERAEFVLDDEGTLPVWEFIPVPTTTP